MGTKIEWAEETWNPIVGCSKVSPGCNNCYAERMAFRIANIEMHTPGRKVCYGHVVHGGTAKWRGETHLVESAMDKPLHWKKPRTIFVCSMGDLFHETVSFNDILEVMYIIDKCPQHTFLLLTKRPERMREFFEEWAPNPYSLHLGELSNIWCGTTIESQDQMGRLDSLIGVSSQKHFISIEPMLGPLDLMYPETHYPDGPDMCCSGIECGCGGMPVDPPLLHYIDWVICGGESGSNARPMHPDWVRSIRNQCVDVGVPFMFKQWGEWAPTEWGTCPSRKRMGEWITAGRGPYFDEGTMHNPEVYGHRQAMCRVGKKDAGRELDGKIWNEKPIK